MEVVKELLENSAYIEHRDMVGAKPHGKCRAENGVAKPRVNVCVCVCPRVAGQLSHGLLIKVAWRLQNCCWNTGPTPTLQDR